MINSSEKNDDFFAKEMAKINLSLRKPERVVSGVKVTQDGPNGFVAIIDMKGSNP